MKLEYNYTIGPEGIQFALLDDAGDQLRVDATPEQRLTIQRYVMNAWQEAINATSSGPEEIRELMASREGQAVLIQRAESYLMDLLKDMPPDLDRRSKGAAAREPWDPAKDRRRLGKPKS
ncbi:MAG: hypothetical protein M0037_01180 [Betaproteobacteria bacterium]|nr:hypothetical protein [Betaproteobacteria bacterium]